jgi:hypothetical protein
MSVLWFSDSADWLREALGVQVLLFRNDVNCLCNGFSSKTFSCLGLFVINPCIDQYRKVDLRVLSFDVPPQEVGIFVLWRLNYLYLPLWSLSLNEYTFKCSDIVERLGDSSSGRGSLLPNLQRHHLRNQCGGLFKVFPLFEGLIRWTFLVD